MAEYEVPKPKLKPDEEALRIAAKLRRALKDHTAPAQDIITGLVLEALAHSALRIAAVLEAIHDAATGDDGLNVNCKEERYGRTR